MSFIPSPSSFMILQRMTLHKEESEAQTFFSLCLLSLCVALLLGASFFCSPLGLSKLIFFVLPAQSKEMDGSLFLGRYEGGTKGFSFAKKARKNLGKSLFSPLPQIQIDCRCNSLFPLGGKRCLLPPPFSPNKLRL